MFNATLFPSSAASVLVVATSTLAAAQDTTHSRYAMEKTDSGIVRMDTATGEMSLCHEREGRMDCTMAGDQRSALDDRIDRLEERLSTLEKQVSDLKASRSDALPSDKDLDRAMGVIEDFMRRFFNMVDNLNKDFKDRTREPEGAPGPQNT